MQIKANCLLPTGFSMGSSPDYFNTMNGLASRLVVYCGWISPAIYIFSSHCFKVFHVHDFKTISPWFQGVWKQKCLCLHIFTRGGCWSVDFCFQNSGGNTGAPPPESATSAEFDQFLAQRASKGETLPAERPRPQMQKAEDQSDELFSLWSKKIAKDWFACKK